MSSKALPHFGNKLPLVNIDTMDSNIYECWLGPISQATQARGIGTWKIIGDVVPAMFPDDVLVLGATGLNL